MRFFVHRSLGNPDFPFEWRFTGVAVATALVAGPQSQPYHCTERGIGGCTNESRRKKKLYEYSRSFYILKVKEPFRRMDRGGGR